MSPVSRVKVMKVKVRCLPPQEQEQEQEQDPSSSSSQSPSSPSDDDNDNPGFYWDGANLRWVRDDKRGLPLSDWKEGGLTQIKPKTGVAYTVWPAVHISLTNFGLESLPVEEALTLVRENKAVIVDVRPEYQYNKYHIEPSVNIPLYRNVEGKSLMDQIKKVAVAAMAMKATERNPNFGEDARRILGDEKRRIIVACQLGGSMETEVVSERKNKTFKDPEKAFGRESRSLKAAYELIEEGYTNIAHLEGGISMWEHKELPVS